MSGDGSTLRLYGLVGVQATTPIENRGNPMVTKYHFTGGKRVAMDREGVLQYPTAGQGSSP